MKKGAPRSYEKSDRHCAASGCQWDVLDCCCCRCSFSLSALFAAIYTRLTFRLVRSQSEPNVVIYVKHDESRTTFLQIVIENIGRGLATDIKFASSRPIPIRAWGIKVEDAETADEMTEGPLVEGIPAPGPGDSRKIVWGQYGGLMRALGNEKIVLSYEYKDGTRDMPSRRAILGCSSFTGTDAVDSEAVRVIKELKHIATAVESLGTRNELTNVAKHH